LRLKLEAEAERTSFGGDDDVCTVLGAGRLRLISTFRPGGLHRVAADMPVFALISLCFRYQGRHLQHQDGTPSRTSFRPGHDVRADLSCG
jgi:hypothetical protein